MPGKKAKHEAPGARRSSCPSRERLVGDDDFGVRMMGIGGTGVVTVNQVLGMAALIDGLHVRGLDQTGLSQKGGPVISDLRITREPLAAASKAPAGSVDLYLGFDLLGAASAEEPRRPRIASARSRSCPRARSRPGGWSSTWTSASPSWQSSSTRSTPPPAASTTSTWTRSALSERLFGDHMMTNTLALGAAYQRGLLPVSGEALERAIELNGAAVEKNLAALRWGRAVVAAPDAVEAATRAPEPSRPCASCPTSSSTSSDSRVNGDRGELRRLAEMRVPELVAYQDADWARR